MEKTARHCKLVVVKAMFRGGQVRTTSAEREGGVVLGLDFDGMIAAVMALTTADFHKSIGRLPARDDDRRGLSEADGVR